MVTKKFKKIFSEEELRILYFKKIYHNSVPGIDRINRKNFELNLHKNLKIIERKVLNASYSFTPYKEKLIIKGRDSTPRIISIPTIRDKLTLKALNELLIFVFSDKINTKIVQTIIHSIKSVIKSNNYDSFIKLDIEKFYPSINHELLFRKIRRKLRKKEVIILLEKAIKNKTVVKSKLERDYNTVGIPQGLSISNILSSIYMWDIDRKYGSNDHFSYFRYVDDILILCKKDMLFNIKEKLIKDLNHIDLKINEKKTLDGFIYNGFQYLGYKYNDNIFSVRKRSVDNLKESIINTFAQYKYSRNSNIKILEWKLNLRITGCKFENQKYGWIFFFSQIDDLNLLYKLDWFVRRMFSRFDINYSDLKIKKFVRTYLEITKNLSNTKYIPDFSTFDISQKKELLREIFNIKNH